MLELSAALTDDTPWSDARNLRTAAASAERLFTAEVFHPSLLSPPSSGNVTLGLELATSALERDGFPSVTMETLAC